MEISIRNAQKRDMKAVLALIQELADYEKAPDEVEMTVERLQEDGFGDEVLFRCIVAEGGGEVLGMALYYPKYSTWKGRCLFLEDLVVSAQHRKRGIGKMLLCKLGEIAKEYGSRRLEWQVLDWNEDAIAFYKSLGVEMDDEWINCKWSKDQLGRQK